MTHTKARTLHPNTRSLQMDEAERLPHHVVGYDVTRGVSFTLPTSTSISYSSAPPPAPSTPPPPSAPAGETLDVHLDADGRVVASHGASAHVLHHVLFVEGTFPDRLLASVQAQGEPLLARPVLASHYHHLNDVLATELKALVDAGDLSHAKLPEAIRVRIASGAPERVAAAEEARVMRAEAAARAAVEAGEGRGEEVVGGGGGGDGDGWEEVVEVATVERVETGGSGSGSGKSGGGRKRPTVDIPVPGAGRTLVASPEMSPLPGEQERERDLRDLGRLARGTARIPRSHSENVLSINTAVPRMAPYANVLPPLASPATFMATVRAVADAKSPLLPKSVGQRYKGPGSASSDESTGLEGAEQAGVRRSGSVTPFKSLSQHSSRVSSPISSPRGPPPVRALFQETPSGSLALPRSRSAYAFDPPSSSEEDGEFPDFGGVEPSSLLLRQAKRARAPEHEQAHEQAHERSE